MLDIADGLRWERFALLGHSMGAGIASMVAPLLFTQVFAAAVGPYRSWNVPGIPFLIAALLLVWALVIARRSAAQQAAPAAAVE